jgi:copper chaperone CopZ
VVFVVAGLAFVGWALSTGDYTQKLGGMPGVQEVRPQVPQKHVYVRYEPAKVQEPTLKTALNESGFVVVET